MHSEARAKLVAEFPELNDPEVNLAKEVYAHFGLAFFKFALVEHSLVNVLIFSIVGEAFASGKIRTKAKWEETFDAAEARAISLTFGNLAKEVLKIQELAELKERLAEIKRLRDYFAHHFMRDEAAYFGSDEGCWLLLEKISGVREPTLQLEADIQPRFRAMCARLKMPQVGGEQLQDSLEQFKADARSAAQRGDAKMGWER